MRIIARRTLREYVESLAGHRDRDAVKRALDAWFAEVSRANWASTSDVKFLYATASIVTAERVGFNIKGNAHRLVVSVDFPKAIVWIEWVGSPRAYDATDVTEVEHDD